MLLSQIGEVGLINKIKLLTQKQVNNNVIIGIDDDAAAIRITDGDILLLTTDTMIQGVHFDLSYFTFYQLGQKAIAVNISDIAAMGGSPSYALVALSVPPNIEIASVEQLYQGMIDLGGEYNVSIIGGDTTSSPKNIYISISLIGQTNPEEVISRGGAKEGDVICVTGFLGMSKAGLKILRNRAVFNQTKFGTVISKHLTPEPRVQEARFLVQNTNINSMIDISDGLSSDLTHICESSNVGAEIYANTIPVDRLTKEVALYFNESWIDYSVDGGEDFELLITLDEKEYQKIKQKFENRFGLKLTTVGYIKEKGQGINIIYDDGKITSLGYKGYNHFSK